MRTRVVDYAERLRRVGVDIALDGDDLGDPVPPRFARVAAALDLHLSKLSGQPMMGDLAAELGLSQRQLQRLVSHLHDSYGFYAGGWIDTRTRRRVMVAAALLSTGATAVRVASLVGYSSPQVMARAFAMRNYPPPSAVAAAVEELGRR